MAAESVMAEIEPSILTIIHNNRSEKQVDLEGQIEVIAPLRGTQ